MAQYYFRAPEAKGPASHGTKFLLLSEDSDLSNLWITLQSKLLKEGPSLLEDMQSNPHKKRKRSRSAESADDFLVADE
jgi:hypothetical protein